MTKDDVIGLLVFSLAMGIWLYEVLHIFRVI